MSHYFSAQQLLEMEQSVENLKAVMSIMIEGYAVSAKFKREKYEALLREGFSETQAMQIVIAGKDDITL
ncbi:hypothetical protein [Rummeliibacillus stabekisii]|uniref:Uncharacterized protein n=1 Tax=Rummeliibacillus stabekisii TaxID=241244 RepID=A0A143HCV7_9BACL|nr:hypothetical protein [Rummeliibacillus stabekisii]AMW99326.1 hypothetical protein ATY39_07525 [Rummeliibacillus stabekisii]